MSDRYRIVLETEKVDEPGTPRLVLGTFDGYAVTISAEPRPERRIVSVEKIPDPEPEWQTGDVGVCEHGYTYLRSARGDWINGVGEVSGNETCRRTLIVRDGKPVTA